MQGSENIKCTITKEVYRTILENLLNTKELQDVTTTEIIERSGLSRATFYKHFKDKYELAQWEYDYLMQQLVIESQSAEDSAENIRKIVYYVNSRRHIYKKILKYTGQNSFHENYVRHAFRVAQETARRSGRELTAKDHYVIQYHAAGFLRVIDEWMKSDDPSVTADDIVRVVNENRSEPLKLLYIG